MNPEKRKRLEKQFDVQFPKYGSNGEKPRAFKPIDTRVLSRGLRPNLSMGSEKTRKRMQKVGGGSVDARLAEALRNRVGGEKPLTKPRNFEPSKDSSDGDKQAYEVQKRIGPIIVDGDDWYLYGQGKYSLVKKDIFEPIALDVQAPNNRNPRRAKDTLNTIQMQSRLRLGEKLYGCMRFEDESRTNYLLNCPSRVLIIEFATGKIVGALEHSPEFNFTGMLGADYDDEAECPLFEKTLEEVQSHPLDRELLLNWSTTILLPHSKFEVALCNVGEGANGKSIIMESIANAIGWENVTTATLNQICAGDRKQVWKLEKALLNLSTETDIKRIPETSTFKHIVSGERFPTERIFREGFDMQTTCKICPLANHVPSIAGGAYANTRRFEFLHWPIIFEGVEKDMDLKEKLKGEATGIFRLLIERLPQVCAMKSLGHGGPNSQVIRKLFALSNNPVKIFADDYLVLDLTFDKFITKDDLWKAYRRFCGRQNIEAGDRSDFFKQLLRYKPQLDRWDRRKVVNGIRETAFRKIEFSEKGKALMKS